jgi:hypothetical protein
VTSSDRPRPRDAALLVATLVVLLAGCSTDPSDPSDPVSAPTATVTVTETATPDAAASSAAAPRDAVSVTASSAGTSSFRSDLGDLGWMDATWEAATDVDWVSFRLQGEGVRTVGAPISVPPVNTGGTIAVGGEFQWPPDHAVRTTRGLSWFQRASTRFLSMSAGDTGLLVFHLRFDEDVVAGEQQARATALRTRWTLPDGTEGEATTPVDQTWSFDRDDCR